MVQSPWKVFANPGISPVEYHNPFPKMSQCPLSRDLEVPNDDDDDDENIPVGRFVGVSKDWWSTLHVHIRHVLGNLLNLEMGLEEKVRASSVSQASNLEKIIVFFFCLVLKVSTA